MLGNNIFLFIFEYKYKRCICFAVISIKYNMYIEYIWNLELRSAKNMLANVKSFIKINLR